MIFLSRLDSAQWLFMEGVSCFSMTVRSTCLWMSELAKLHHSLPVYFIGVVFLHVAFKTIRDSLTEELLDVLATIYRLARQTSTTDKDLERFYESIQQFIGDVLGLASVRCEQNVRYERKLGVHEHSASPVTLRRQLNKSELVELLQQSAVEHLTTWRQLKAHLYSLAYVVTADFEALYAYKRSEYQHCLQLSALNIRTLFDHIDNGCLKLPPTNIFMLPEIIQLMKGDIVSFMGLAAIVVLGPSSRDTIRRASISQLSLSLYLMTECQIKLRQSLNRTYDYVRVTARNLDWSIWPLSLDKLLIKLVERKIQKYIMS